MGGGGGGSNLFANPTGTPAQPSAMPGYVPPAPVMPPQPVQPPNLGAPAAPMPQLAPGAILPPQQQQPMSTANRLTAVGKALQNMGTQQQQQPRRGQPVDFRTAPLPYIPPPTPTGNGG